MNGKTGKATKYGQYFGEKHERKTGVFGEKTWRTTLTFRKRHDNINNNLLFRKKGAVAIAGAGVSSDALK